MNKDEYVIINRTTLEKRIEELEKKSKEIYYREGIDEYDFAKLELEELLSQSTPLVPEIEKAFEAGQFEEYKQMSFDGGENYETVRIIKEKQDYISNLKLDI